MSTPNTENRLKTLARAGRFLSCDITCHSCDHRDLNPETDRAWDLALRVLFIHEHKPGE